MCRRVGGPSLCKPMSRLLFIRHAQASFFSDNYDQLSEKGFVQARLLGEQLVSEKVPFDKVYVGPLLRQKQTLEEVRKAYKRAGLTFPTEDLILPELSEHSGSSVMRELMPFFQQHDPIFQEYVSKVVSKVETEPAEQIQHFLKAFHHFLRLWATDNLGTQHPSHIETWQAFRARVNRGIHRMMEENQEGQTIAAFSSAGAVSASVGFVTDMKNEQKVVELGGQVRNSSISEYVFSGKRINLHAFNRTPHIKDPTLITHI